MPKKETIAVWCLLAGTILGGFTKLYVITAVFSLIVLAIDLPLLMEEYKAWKRQKQQ